MIYLYPLLYFWASGLYPATYSSTLPKCFQNTSNSWYFIESYLQKLKFSNAENRIHHLYNFLSQKLESSYIQSITKSHQFLFLSVCNHLFSLPSSFSLHGKDDLFNVQNTLENVFHFQHLITPVLSDLTNFRIMAEICIRTYKTQNDLSLSYLSISPKEIKAITVQSWVKWKVISG